MVCVLGFTVITIDFLLHVLYIWNIYDWFDYEFLAHVHGFLICRFIPNAQTPKRMGQVHVLTGYHE